VKRTLLGMLDTAAREFGGTPYCYRKIEAGWTPKSFLQVREEARAIAVALRARGFHPAGKAVILGEGSPEWVAFEFAVLTAGAISVPLSIKLLAEEVPFRVTHSDATVIGVSWNQLGKLASVYAELKTRPLVVLLEDTDVMLEQARTTLSSAQITSYQELLAFGMAAAPDARAEIDQIAEEVGEESIATISYTSGTTGNPKGIMLTHLNYYANSHAGVQMFEVPSDYSTMVILPCDHSFAHTVAIYAAPNAGISLSFVDARGGGAAILRNIPINMKETNPVFVLTVPALTGNFMKKIIHGVAEKGRFVNGLFWAGVRAGIRRNGDGFNRPGLFTRLGTWFMHAAAEALIFRTVRKTFGNRIKFFVGGGALLDRGQQDFFCAIGLPVYQGYGLTEAAPIISSNTPKAFKFGSSGRMAPGVTCRITLDDGTQAAAGESGEICVQGENVMAGYYKNEKATSEVLVDGWLHTGDLGHIDRDGFLVVTGRAKALLISSDGEKYSPEEIEETITTNSDLVHQIMVYNDHRNYTTALVTLDTGRVEKLVKYEQIRDARSLLSRVHESLMSYTRAGKHFPAQWTPASFVILREPFTEANRMINSSMKMVRHKVTEFHADDIDYLYTGEGHRWDSPRNCDRVADMFGLSAE
jgi:long-chain acyl-CoA synthetase